MSVDDIHAALDRDAFELWFQPILCLRTLEVRSFEGLARVRDADGCVLSPAQFIDTVESDEATYRRFTLTMIEQAADFAYRCALVGRAPLITVNLAEPSLRDPALVDQVDDILRQRGVPPRQLVFEITEREFLDPTSVQSGVLQRMSALGVGLAIDDFGTGWSSLETLRWLPLSQIKIDRSFLERVVTHTADRIIVEKVIELAHSLHLVVVAEGIERTEQLDAVRAAGCDRGQGFLFARAVEESEALDIARLGIGRSGHAGVGSTPTPGHDLGHGEDGSSPFVADTDDTCVSAALDRSCGFGPLGFQLLDQLPMAVFVKAPDGRIVWSNESHWRRVGGSSRQDVLDHRDLELHRVDEALRYRVDDLAVFSTGIPVVDRREVQTRPNGDRVVLRTSKFPVRNRLGATIGLIGFFTEVDDDDELDAGVPLDPHT